MFACWARVTSFVHTPDVGDRTLETKHGWIQGQLRHSLLRLRNLSYPFSPHTHAILTQCDLDRVDETKQAKKNILLVQNTLCMYAAFSYPHEKPRAHELPFPPRKWARRQTAVKETGLPHYSVQDNISVQGTVQGAVT